MAKTRRWFVVSGSIVIAVQLTVMAYTLGYLPIHRPIARNSDAEIARLLTFAKNGNARDQLRLSDLYYERAQKDTKQFKDAFYWAKLAAENGNTEAMYAVGLMYLHGAGVPRDLQETFKWFSKGANNRVADKGAVDCMVGLAQSYDSGIGIEHDKKLAIEWYEKALASGSGHAAMALAQIYEKSDQPDLRKKTADLYKKAIENPALGTEYAIALHYEKSKEAGAAEKAIEWYKKAAAYGHVEASNRLAWMYREGTLVPANKKIAFEYALQSANRGSAEGQMRVAIFYRDGVGTMRDLGKAEEWAKRSALQGHHYGQLVYGMIIFDKTHDPVRAYPWVKRAVLAKVGDGETYLEELQTNMSQAQYEQGENLASIQFDPKPEPLIPYLITPSIIQRNMK